MGTGHHSGIHHINIVVSDLDAAVGFFSLLGFSLRRSKRISGKWLDAVTGLEGVEAEYRALASPGSPVTIELLCFINPPSREAVGTGEANRIGYRHIAVAVDDIRKRRSELQAAGVEFISEVQTNSYGALMCYTRGPDGILVELLQPEGEGKES